MKIFVTGSNGQLGREIQRLSTEYQGYSFTFTDIGELDVTKEEQVRKFFENHHPDVIINCAAYTAVDKAETEKESAMALNSAAPGHLAKVCQETGAALVHISTDYVFDGTHTTPYKESDPANPKSVYALSKQKGEEEIIKHKIPGVILRTSWLYSEFGNNFVKTILRKAEADDELRVVYDQVGTPTYAADLANVIFRILPEVVKFHSVELFHYSNEGVTSWFDFAHAIAEISGIRCRIHPVLTTEFKQAAHRPAFSVMDKTLIVDRFKLEIPYWRNSLAQCLDRIRKSNQ
jgi:dTDP-4-dehydrorhamnose reductase